MSGEGMTWAKQQTAGSPAAKAVLIYLGQLVGGADQSTTYSQARIAADLEMSPSTVYRALTALEERGLIRRVKDYWQDSGKRKYDTIFLAISPLVNMTDGPLVTVTSNEPLVNLTSNRNSLETTLIPPNPHEGVLDVEAAISRTETATSRFEEFWKKYPSNRRGDKQAAKRLFQGLMKRGVPPQLLIDHLINNIAALGDYFPASSKYLKEERYWSVKHENQNKQQTTTNDWWETNVVN